MIRRLNDNPEEISNSEEAQHLDESIASLRQALSGLKYGSVSLTVHEGRVVQIDVTEKLRLKPN
jgi:hypothetical protein